jgi:hypothetical protein
MEDLRYFDVEKEILTISQVRRYGVYKDGTPVCPSYEVESEDNPKEIVVGFHVIEYDEAGMIQNIEFYPVKTDMGTFENNEDEVLSKIVEEHDSSEWQNNNW